MLFLCNSCIPFPDVLVGLGKLLDVKKEQEHTLVTRVCGTVQLASAFISSEVYLHVLKGDKLYQSTLLHLSISLLHLLDSVFPLVDELLCLQMGLLQIFFSFIQSNLLGKQKTGVFS